MNITEDMYNMESMKIHDCIKKHIKHQIRSLPDEQFFWVIQNSCDDIQRYIDKGYLQEMTAADLDIGDSEQEQAFLHANIDQVLDSDWFNRYIQGEVAGRQGELDKHATDSSAFTMEKNRIANKNG